MTENKELPIDSTKQYSDEEISKILNTAKATRTERDEAAKKAKELEENNRKLSEQLEQIKGIDPKRFKELEQLAQTYEDKKLEDNRQFSDLKERWQGERTTLSQQINQLQGDLKQTKITNALEKAFYSVGGKAGKDDEGYTYFDMISNRAMQFVEVDENGKLLIIDPRDRTKMVTEKGAAFTIEDLMLKFRSAGPTTSLFEPANNSAGSGMNRSTTPSSANTREQLMKLPRAERLAKARELGI